ncbi:phytanoyl-CoA dioxygenase family protein [Pseudarthrobacter sp. NKDBFgelt]|uniref:phytanoyl-CoA dioxygenase family protein n=1 Tax=Pseudarthrobacter sp. NKDBFgelt TaxID=3384443 RepID=UPI0038D42437
MSETNVSADVKLTTLPNTASVEEAVEVIYRDGGVIIEGLFDDETIAGLRADLDRTFNKEVSFGEEAEFLGAQTRRAGKLFARSKHMVDIALNPLYYGIAKNILQKTIDIWIGQTRQTIVPDIQIGVTQAIQIHPGQGAQPLHRDDMVFLWRHPDYNREGRVQIMVAVSDFTKENGGTLVIPESHKWDDERMPLNEEAISTEMTAGSALIWIGSTYHGGGNNSSTAPRTGLTMAYDLANLRQEENQYLSLPLATLKELPEEIQRLLGWDSGDNYMGYVEIDGQFTNPHTLLQGDHEATDAVGIAAPK